MPGPRPEQARGRSAREGRRTRARVNALVGEGIGGPLASTQAGIEKFFFGQPNGWLSAEPESALNAALLPVLDDLRAASEPASPSSRRAVTLRSAADLPDDKWERLESVINALVRQARQQQSE